LYSWSGILIHLPNSLASGGAKFGLVEYPAAAMQMAVAVAAISTGAMMLPLSFSICTTASCT
jgi:hypothetical protein